MDEIIDRQSVFTVRKSNKDEGDYILLRRADIIDDRLIVPFINENESKYFENRTYIYRNNGPDTDGYIGVWKWSALHNKYDYEKDHVKSEYDSSISLIKIIRLRDGIQYSNQMLIQFLKDGINETEQQDVLITWKIGSKDEFKAIYLRRQEQEIVNNRIVVKRGVIKLPTYYFTKSNFIKIDNHYYLNTTRIKSEPNDFIMIKQPFEVVKEIFLEKSNWQSLKLQGYSRNTYKEIKTFLESVDTETIKDSIKDVLNCNGTQADHYINAFIASANKIIDGSTINDEILLSIIERNKEVKEQLEKLYSDRWMAEHETERRNAETQLKEIQDETERMQKSLAAQSQELESKMIELNSVKEKIDHLELIGNNAEQAAKDKIISAKNDISSFINEIVLLSGMIPSTDTGKTGTGICRGYKIETEYDINNSWKDELQTIETELSAVGIGDEFISGLAAILYSCYINNFPVLLAGPYGEEIAKAFSASVNCSIPTVIDCSSVTADLSLKAINDEIVVLKNPFSSGKRDSVLYEILYGSDDHFIMMTMPIFDELRIEPIEVLNYFLPLSTDLYFSKKPSHGYGGGSRSQSFQEYKSMGKHKLRHDSFLSALKISTLSLNNIEKIISDARNMNDSLKESFVYMFLLITLAKMTDRDQLLLEEIESEVQLTNRFKEYCVRILGE